MPAGLTTEQRVFLEKWIDDDNKVRYYMLGAMFEQSRTAKYQVCQRLCKTKMHDGQSVQDHCLTMIKDLEEHEKLGIILDKDFQIDVILQCLSDAYDQFIMNFYMHKMQCTLAELMNMLVTAELSLKSSKGSVLTVERTSSKRKSFRKKKKSAKKQKVDGKRKRRNQRRRPLKRKNVSIVIQMAIGNETVLSTQPP